MFPPHQEWDMNPRPRKLYSNISGRQMGIQTRDTIPLITSYPYSRIAECHVWGCNWMGFTLCAIAVKVQVKYTFTLHLRNHTLTGAGSVAPVAVAPQSHQDGIPTCPRFLMLCCSCKTPYLH